MRGRYNSTGISTYKAIHTLYNDLEAIDIDSISPVAKWGLV